MKTKNILQLICDKKNPASEKVINGRKGSFANTITATKEVKNNWQSIKEKTRCK